jgi:dipeptidyl aminopeptidase/acylaminoacyl peptidase
MEHYEYRDICGVPSIVLHPATEPVGQVVLYHGWGSTIDSYKFFASLISNWRYKVIIPELPLHGERGSLNYSDETTMQAHFWPVVFQAVEDAQKIVSDLSQNTECPITMIGHSTGGFITAGAFAKQQQVHSAVVINGSCAWIQFEELYREKLRMNPMEASEKDALQQHDPLSHIRLNPAKPLLLLHCQEDTTVPIDSQRYFVNAISNEDNLRDYIQFIEYPKVDHQITLGMLQKIKEFLDKTLLPSVTITGN